MTFDWSTYLQSLFAVVAGFGLCHAAFAEPAWMGEGELSTTFSGATINGHYIDGRKFTERYFDDKALTYSEGPRQATGHWSVISGTFCTIYTGDPSGGCFRVAQIGNNCFEFYFVARTEEQVRRRDNGKPGWTAKAWISDRPATCDEEPIV
jgi:hypothetical protein